MAGPVGLAAGYRPGLIGQIVELHARYYAAQHGFGSTFESKVAAGLADFIPRLDNPRNGIWSIIEGETILGSIAIDGEDIGHGSAHLRWFIIDETARGSGHGRVLLAAALGHCRSHGFQDVQLWTFAGLDAARRLYEHSGFLLVEDHPGEQWGKTVNEQRFCLKLAQQG